jgi:hypothetical protein
MTITCAVTSKDRVLFIGSRRRCESIRSWIKRQPGISKDAHVGVEVVLQHQMQGYVNRLFA